MVAATAAADDSDGAKPGAEVNAGGDSSCGDSSSLLRSSASSDGKKSDEKGGGYGDSAAVDDAASLSAEAETETWRGEGDGGRWVESEGKGVTTDKPSVLGACVRDKVPVARGVVLDGTDNEVEGASALAGAVN